LLKALLVPFLLFPTLCAQTAETLLLPDLLDLRPAAARLTDRIGDLQAEATLQIALGNPTVAAQINAVVALLQSYQTGATPIPPGAGIEFHMVGFYEGDGATSTTPGTATVEVDRPGSVVALILNAYEPITWTITQTAGTNVLAVIAYSYEPQTLNLVGMPGVPSIGLSYVGNNDGDYFGIPNDPTDTNARLLANQFAIDRLGSLLLTFTGDYTAPTGAFAVGPTNPEWVDQWINEQAVAEGLVRCVATRANLFTAYAGVTFLPLLVDNSFPPTPSTVVLASPVGTIAPLVSLPGTTHYAIDPTFTIYTLTNGAPSTLDLSTLTTTPLPPPTTLPPLSFADAFTFDLVRNRLLVSTFSGQGELRAYDVATASWSVLTQWNNDEPRALAYHPTYDQLHGLRIDPFFGNGTEFVVYDPATGAELNAFPLPLPVFDDFLETHQLYPLGPAAAYVGPRRNLFNLPLRHCFVINPTNGDVLFAGFVLG
jgi:hypothetical protein